MSNTEEAFLDWINSNVGPYSFLIEHFYTDCENESAETRKDSLYKWMLAAFEEGCKTAGGRSQVKILHTFEMEVELSLTHDQKQVAQQVINLHYLGDIHCNKLDRKTKLFVSKYPEKETQDFTDAQHACVRTYRVPVSVDLLEDGRLAIHESK